MRREFEILETCRGASPVIGYVLILSIVLFACGIIFMGSGAVLKALSEPRAESSFDDEIITDDEVGIRFAAGDEFSQTDTKEIRVLDVKNDTHEVVFNGTGNRTLAPGDYLVEPSANVSGVRLNSTIHIQWVDADGGVRIIDKLRIPPADELFIAPGDDANGTISSSDGGDGGGSGTGGSDGGGGGGSGTGGSDINVTVE